MHSESLVPPKLRTSLLHFPYPDAFPLVLLLQLSQWVNNLLCGIHYKVAYKLLVNNSYELSRIFGHVFFFFLGKFGKNCNVCFWGYVGFAVLEGLKYASSHEWVKHEGSVATIGITDHAQVSITFVFVFFFPHQVWTLIWSSVVKKKVIKWCMSTHCRHIF